MPENIVEILHIIEDSPTECDGFVRLASFLLTKNSIKHNIMHGSLCHLGKKIPFHFWIVVDNYTIDYRARMWLGNDAPHGVFIPNKDTHYKGKKVNIDPISEVLFTILNSKF